MKVNTVVRQPTTDGHVHVNLAVKRSQNEINEIYIHTVRERIFND